MEKLQYSLTYVYGYESPTQHICVYVFNYNVIVAFLRNLILLRTMLKNSFNEMKEKTQ